MRLSVFLEQMIEREVNNIYELLNELNEKGIVSRITAT
nr:MAG TPA: Transcriptional regulator PadR-like family [Caudoviricetes sp.]